MSLCSTRCGGGRRALTASEGGKGTPTQSTPRTREWAQGVFAILWDVEAVGHALA